MGRNWEEWGGTVIRISPRILIRGESERVRREASIRGESKRVRREASNCSLNFAGSEAPSTNVDMARSTID